MTEVNGCAYCRGERVMPVVRYHEVLANGDHEADVIALCVQALMRLQDFEAQRRITVYLHERFQGPVS